MLIVASWCIPFWEILINMVQNNHEKDHNYEFVVYALIDPFDLKIKYVGRTHNPKRRKRDHITITKSKYKDQSYRLWVDSLKERNNIPTFKILKVCSGLEECKMVESLLIKKIKPEFNIVGK